MSLTEVEKERGIVAISSGNHGIAVSYAAKILGIENVEIVVPFNTPKSKLRGIQHYGGVIKLIGENYDEAHNLGVAYVEDQKKTYIDAYFDDELIYAGQGTIAIEILEERPEVDTILVPIGGGGLITGIAVAAKAINPNVRIIGIQPEACPAMLKAMEDHVFYENYPSEDSICEALVGGVGKLSYELAHTYIDEIVLVSEKMISQGVAHMVRNEKFVVEPSGAICTGAILQYPNRDWGRNVVMVMTGGNIDGDLLLKILKNY